MTNLGPRGGEVYAALTEGRDLTAVHRALILNVARMVDKLDQIADELPEDCLTVINEKGTEAAHPLITEQRMIMTALSTILAKMGISELPEAKAQGKSVVDQITERRLARQQSRDSSGDSAAAHTL